MGRKQIKTMTKTIRGMSVRRKSKGGASPLVLLIDIILSHKFGIVFLGVFFGVLYTFSDMFYDLAYYALGIATLWVILFGGLIPFGIIVFLAVYAYERTNATAIDKQRQLSEIDKQIAKNEGIRTQNQISWVNTIYTPIVNEGQTYLKTIDPDTKQVRVMPLHLLSEDTQAGIAKWQAFTLKGGGGIPEIAPLMLSDEPIQPTDPRPIVIKKGNFSHTFIAGEKDSGKTTFLNATLDYLVKTYPKATIVIADDWNHTQWANKGNPNVIQMSTMDANKHMLANLRERRYIDKSISGGYSLAFFDENLIVYYYPEYNGMMSSEGKTIVCENEGLTVKDVHTLVLTQGTHIDIRIFADGQSFLSKDNGGMSLSILKNFAQIGLGNGEMITYMIGKMSKRKGGKELVEKFYRIQSQSPFCGIVKTIQGEYIPFLTPNWSMYEAKDKERKEGDINPLSLVKRVKY